MHEYMGENLSEINLDIMTLSNKLYNIFLYAEILEGFFYSENSSSFCPEQYRRHTFLIFLPSQFIA